MLTLESSPTAEELKEIAQAVVSVARPIEVVEKKTEEPAKPAAGSTHVEGEKK